MSTGETDTGPAATTEGETDTQSAKTPEKAYADMTIRELKKRVQDPQAAEELLSRYHKMNDKELRAAARSDPVAKSILERRIRPNVALPELQHGEKGEQRVIPHEARARVIDKGGKAGTWTDLKSGDVANLPPEKRELGYPLAQQESHTEAKAIRQIPLNPGETLEIWGTYDPCKPCQEKMRAASEGGRIVIYWWQGGRFRAVNGEIVQTL
jgi:hypothetical protein